MGTLLTLLPPISSGMMTGQSQPDYFVPDNGKFPWQSPKTMEAQTFFLRFLGN